eukprot:3516291-Rhodomonas_salina.1
MALASVPLSLALRVACRAPSQRSVQASPSPSLGLRVHVGGSSRVLWSEAGRHSQPERRLSRGPEPWRPLASEASRSATRARHPVQETARIQGWLGLPTAWA